MSVLDQADGEVLWLDEEAAEQHADSAQPLAPEQQVAKLDEELQRTRKELTDVRKELAAKTVELKRKEQLVANRPVDQMSSGGAPPNTTSVPATELERQLHVLAGQLLQLQTALTQKEEELEEARKLAASQKRAIREAAAIQGDREAAEVAAIEASRAVAGQAVEEELERLAAELAAVKTRSELELQHREAEVRKLRAELDSIQARHKDELAAAETSLRQSVQSELETAQESMRQRLDEYESEVARLRVQLEDARNHSDSSEIIRELAMLNNQKVQVQKELEAMKDMATQASRKAREEVAKLLEENAELHSKLASYKAAEVMGSRTTSEPSTSGRSRLDFMADQPPPGVTGYTSYAYKALQNRLPPFLARLDTQYRGLLPALVVGSLLFLFMLIAVIRAGASTKAQHSGPLCFLAKLGIRIGPGCALDLPAVKDPNQELAQLLDKPLRIHDVEVETIKPLPAEQIEAGVEAQAASVQTEKNAASGQGGSKNQKPAGTGEEPEMKVAEGQQEQEGPEKPVRLRRMLWSTTATARKLAAHGFGA